MGALKAHGGVTGLAQLLLSDADRGLDASGHGAASVAAHQEHFGRNVYKDAKPKSFFSLLYEAYKDPVILILCAAALVRPIQTEYVFSSVAYRPRSSCCVHYDMEYNTSAVQLCVLHTAI